MRRFVDHFLMEFTGEYILDSEVAQFVSNVHDIYPCARMLSCLKHNMKDPFFASTAIVSVVDQLRSSIDISEEQLGTLSSEERRALSKLWIRFGRLFNNTDFVSALFDVQCKSPLFCRDNAAFFCTDQLEAGLLVAELNMCGFEGEGKCPPDWTLAALYQALTLDDCCVVAWGYVAEALSVDDNSCQGGRFAVDHYRKPTHLFNQKRWDSTRCTAHRFMSLEEFPVLWDVFVTEHFDGQSKPQAPRFLYPSVNISYPHFIAFLHWAFRNRRLPRFDVVDALCLLELTQGSEPPSVATLELLFKSLEVSLDPYEMIRILDAFQHSLQIDSFHSTVVSALLNGDGTFATVFCEMLQVCSVHPAGPSTVMLLYHLCECSVTKCWDLGFIHAFNHALRQPSMQRGIAACIGQVYQSLFKHVADREIFAGPHSYHAFAKNDAALQLGEALMETFCGEVLDSRCDPSEHIVTCLTLAIDQYVNFYALKASKGRTTYRSFTSISEPALIKMRTSLRFAAALQRVSETPMNHWIKRLRTSLGIP